MAPDGGARTDAGPRRGARASSAGAAVGDAAAADGAPPTRDPITL